MIYSYTAKPGYRQNHVNYILAINASLFLSEEPSAATTIFDKNFISINLRPHYFYNFMLLLPYAFWNVQHLLLKN